MCGALLNPINTRLEPATVRYILEHSGPKVLLVDRDSTSTVRLALEGLAKDLHGQDPEIRLTPMGE